MIKLLICYVNGVKTVHWYSMDKKLSDIRNSFLIPVEYIEILKVDYVKEFLI